ncbi:MAG: hypothetical protein LC793_07355 [Thermomicrobia bacterium]|nr:hypothetical protein [Thermomicrobia bacterium]
MRTCKKCGSGKVGVVYRPAADMLGCTCRACGYAWMESPEDRKSEEKPAVLREMNGGY